jgi:hypothetical protein
MTLGVVVAGRGHTDTRGGIVMSFTCRVLIMENSLAMISFVARVASTCSHSPASMFWSL